MANTEDPYRSVQAELDQALDAGDPQSAAGACHRASLALARVAAGEGFDPRRHRAIASAIRDAARGGGPTGPAGAVAPLTTRSGQ